MGMAVIGENKRQDRVLITGSSGFLGKYISDTFTNLGYDVKTVGRRPINHYQLDLAKKVVNLNNEIYDIVIHCAGKAHSVPKSEQDKKEFYNVNVGGTENLLKSLNNLLVKPKSFIFISSVAVYGLISGNQINEDTPLKATDSYGNSKILAEKTIQLWCTENKVVCSILRLPLIIGINPLGNLKSMIDGIRIGYYLNIDDGKARKSMVLAEDVANFIPKVSVVGGIYNLTDGHHPNLISLSERIAYKLGKNRPMNLPNFLAFLLAKVGDLLGNRFPLNSDKLIKITSDLTFDDSKARRIANWNSTSILEGLNVS